MDKVNAMGYRLVIIHLYYLGTTQLFSGMVECSPTDLRDPGSIMV